MFTYDAAGNTTRDSTRSYTFNEQGRLNSATFGGETNTYVHNALGQRVQKVSDSHITSILLAGEQGAETVVPVNSAGRYVRVQLAGNSVLSLGSAQARFHGVLAPNSWYREGVTLQSACQVKLAISDVEVEGSDEPNLRAGRRKGLYWAERLLDFSNLVKC